MDKSKDEKDKKKDQKNEKKLRQKETEEERLKKQIYNKVKKFVLILFLINYVLQKKKKVVMTILKIKNIIEK